MRYLVTGAAGFIGFHTSALLLARGDEVVGLDNVCDYYDVSLKEARLAQLASAPSWQFLRADISDRAAVEKAFEVYRPDKVIHLAAQAGVRYSLTNPHLYVQSNLTGFLHILEGCRVHDVRHLVFASTSSVYGANTHLPFSTHSGADHPLTLYAATKKSNELMAHSYSHLYGLPATGLRFFTVYGPWGRPDMALFLFTRAIINREPLQVFNNGQMRRDFTFVGDIAQSVIRVADRPAVPDPHWQSEAPDPASSSAPYRLYNVGNSQPTDLLRYIRVIEDCLGKKAILNLLPMQPGDVPATWADVEDLAQHIGYRPRTSVEEGVRAFVEWYRAYYVV